MGTVIIFGLVTILAIIGLISSLKSRNFLGFVLAAATVAVFGFFTIATVFFDGLPKSL